jgi:HEPN domain-containing protein
MASPEAQNMLQIAKADLETAIASSDPTIFRETAWGFWLQQSVEKALKDWLLELGNTPPLSHDLTKLLKLLLEQNIDIAKFLELDQLTDYAVQIRYDADPKPLGLDRIALNQQVQTLINQVEAVVTGLTKS